MMSLPFFHPKRFWRKTKDRFQRFCFLLNCKIVHVECRLGNNVRLSGCRVSSKVDGIIVIGDRCVVRNCTFAFYGVHGQVILGNDVIINARADSRTGLFSKDGTMVVIGDQCLLSNGIEISTTDWHYLVDDHAAVVNSDKSVNIGSSVWICRRVLVGKGVTIGKGSVIGAGSIVTKSFTEENVLIAGNPAVIKEQGIHWH